MVTKILSTIIVALLAVVLWGEALYVSNETVLFAWDRGSPPESGAEHYEVKAVWEGALGIKQEYDIGSTEDTQMVVTRPRVGLFSLWVRAVNDEGSSEWAKSTDPEAAKVDGLPRGWRVYFDLSAPSGGGVT